MNEITQLSHMPSFGSLAELSFNGSDFFQELSRYKHILKDSLREVETSNKFGRYFSIVINKIIINNEQLDGFVIYKDSSFNYYTKEHGFRYIVNNIDVLPLYSYGERVIGFGKENNYSFYFCTKESGCHLIVNGEDVLQKFNDGEKVIHCHLDNEGYLTLRTEKYGFKLIKNGKDVFPFFTNGENVYSFSREDPEFIVITTVSGKVIKASKELINNIAGDNLITE